MITRERCLILALFIMLAIAAVCCKVPESVCETKIFIALCARNFKSNTSSFIVLRCNVLWMRYFSLNFLFSLLITSHFA